jgi:hypothetical protein
MASDRANVVHSALQLVIARLRGVAAVGAPTQVEVTAAIASSRDALTTVVRALSEHPEIVGACEVILAEIGRRIAVLEARDQSADALIDALSATESELTQLRELTSRFVGRRTVHGPSELARATRCRAVIARLLRLAQYGAHDETALQRARLVGAGITNLLGSDSEQLLSIRSRSTLGSLRRRIHELLVAAVSNESVAEAQVVGLLSDVVAVLELMLGQTNADLREHDLSMLKGAKTFFDARDPRSAMFVVDSLRGLDEELDRAIVGGQAEEVAMTVDALLAQFSGRASLAAVFDFSLDSSLPPSE